MKIRGPIRYKILLVVLPILILTSLFLGVTAYYSSRNGITSLAKEFLGYKLNELYKYATRQNTLIREMNMGNDMVLLDNARTAVADYARTVIDSRTGGFLCLSDEGAMQSSTLTNGMQAHEINELMGRTKGKTSGWVEFTVHDVPVVAVFIHYTDWNSVFVIFNVKDDFYKSTRSILSSLLVIIAFSTAIASVLVLFFVAYLTRPVSDFVRTIEGITQDMNLTQRVKIVYHDEIGYLGASFNRMIAELEGAYNQIKNYAYQTVLAKNKEERIRFIFQKYVPTEVINTILNISSDSMLIGNRQKVSVLFSDIRDFTSISESLTPEDLVLSLNSYFNEMGAEISRRHGIIDKFIGDAIMAIFGAPVIRPDDAESAVRAALAMITALDHFNQAQAASGKTKFRIGVGINTGEAIVGNIGSEQKIDYTVIGDTVNLASRLEGLSKKYHARIIISEFTRESIESQEFYYRELDNVRVKGKVKGVKIYEPFLLAEAEALIPYYEECAKAQYLYYAGHFYEAAREFERLSQVRPDDYLAHLYHERCVFLDKNPPENWDGIETFTEK